MTIGEMHDAIGKLIEKHGRDIEAYVNVHVVDEDFGHKTIDIEYWSIAGLDEWAPDDKELNHLHIVLDEMVSG